MTARWIEGLPAITGCLYLAAAVGYGLEGRWGWSLTYAAYAVANAGLILAALENR